MVLSNLTSTVTNINITSRCSHFTVSQCDTLINLKIVLSIISMILVMIAVILALLLNKYKVLAERIVLMIIVTAWLSNLCTVAHDGGPDNDTSCIIVGYFSLVLDLVTVFSFMALIIFILLRIRFNKDTSRYQWLYASMIIIPAVIIAFIPLEVYGPAGAWCWITDERHIYRMTLYWFPVVISSICVTVIFIYLYIYSKRFIRRYRDDNENNQQALVNQYLKPYVGIGFAYLILQTIMFANQLNDWVGGSPNYDLYIVHTIGISLNGVIYSALLFTTNTWTDFKPSSIIGGIRRLIYDISSYSCREDGCCCDQNGNDDPIETVPGNGETTMVCVSPHSALRSSMRKESRNPTLPTIASGGSSTDSAYSSPEPSISNQVSDQVDGCPSGVARDNSKSELESITSSDVDCATPHPPPRRKRTSSERRSPV